MPNQLNTPQQILSAINTPSGTPSPSEAGWPFKPSVDSGTADGAGSVSSAPPMPASSDVAPTNDFAVDKK